MLEMHFWNISGNELNLFLIFFGIPRPERMHIPSSESWVFPCASYQWDMPEIPLNGGIIIRETTSTDSF